mgnify:FL=1
MKYKYSMSKKLLTVLIISLALLFFFYLSRPPVNLENKNLILSRECYQVILKTIRGSSMEPLLKDGEKVKFLMDYYNCHPLSRNEIIVISFKTQPNKLYIKKLAGLPKDKVEIKNNYLFINGQLVRNSENKPYLVQGKGETLLLKPLINQRISDGYYLVLSEDPNSTAFDSRYFGYLEKTHILGKVIK